MKIQGNLKKMPSVLQHPVEYFFNFDKEEVLINSFLGKKIQITFTGKIHCIQCGRETKKSFQQGYCFPCFRRVQECNLCIIHPERCNVELGHCPENDWAHHQCHQSHVVYLANSSNLKVGVTKATQVPTRWIDQGAMQAMAIATTKNRYQAGLLEVALKKYISDRTNWRSMLRHQITELDLHQEKVNLLKTAEKDLAELFNRYSNDIQWIQDPHITSLDYPILKTPEKINPLSLDKMPDIIGTLLGIKGQYLIFDAGVLNIRKFSGYEIQLNYNE